MKKVLVAMSGGVDSSVAAALLQKQGYFVVGGFMKNFSPESWDGVLDDDCPWEQDFADVQAVCEKLGIECRSFNFEKEYKKKVIEHFFDEYAAGHTPNPDIMCNKEIKFGLFLERALDLGFDYIATGHYARITKTSSVSPPRAGARMGEVMEYQLLKGLDPKKDQSYFLYTLTQEQLSNTLFPIGKYAKPQVRDLARQFDLPNAEKKDSQGICFVGRIKLLDFLKQRLPEKIGQIVNPAGEAIGEHRGAWYYTIGQRHGLGLGGGAPYYVAQKDVLNNVLTVTTTVYAGLVQRTQCEIKDIHWINSPPELPLHCQAKIRYQQPDQDCTIFPSPGVGRVPKAGEVAVELQSPQFAIAPGQSVVFYDGDKVLGGGVVEN